MPVTVTAESPDTPDAVALIAELEAELEPHYPSTSRHGYSVDTLLRERVAFFVIRDHGQAAGCGGIQLVDGAYGELKRMYVRPRFRGRGLARRMVEHLVAYAGEHGISVVRLETGVHQSAAIALYEAMGFGRIGPFGPYRDDPLSVFLELRTR